MYAATPQPGVPIDDARRPRGDGAETPAATAGAEKPAVVLDLVDSPGSDGGSERENEFATLVVKLTRAFDTPREDVVNIVELEQNVARFRELGGDPSYFSCGAGAALGNCVVL